MHVNQFDLNGEHFRTQLTLIAKTDLPMRVLLFIIVLLCRHSEIYAVNVAPEYPRQMDLVGSSNFSILWWNIYNAELYSINGFYQREQRKILLKLTYQRDIKSTELIEETDRQWKRFKITKNKRQQWLNELKEIWPDVTQNDHIAFYIDSEGNCHFYFNEQYIGSLHDAEFSRQFANIWLADKGPYPKFTRRLTGQN